MTPDVYAAAAELETNGVRFHKRPDEGRMKGIAFALDPDGYWVEIVRRAATSPVTNKYTFAQTMLRIKDPSKSIPFYTDFLGMNLLSVSHHHEAKFSNYFLSTLPPGTQVPADPETSDAMEFMRNSFEPVLELTHNHGTEQDADFKFVLSRNFISSVHVSSFTDDVTGITMEMMKVRVNCADLERRASSLMI
jgi:lactoylglutathione lyase